MADHFILLLFTDRPDAFIHYRYKILIRLFMVHHTGLSLRERYSRHGQILIIYEFLSVPLYLHLYRTL